MVSDCKVLLVVVPSYLILYPVIFRSVQQNQSDILTCKVMIITLNRKVIKMC